MKWISKGFLSYLPLFIIVLFLTQCGVNTSTPVITQSGDFALLALSNTPRFDFGFKAVGTQTEQAFTVSNIGKLVASAMDGSFYLSVSYAFKDGTYPGTGGSCGTTLARGASCTIIVVFSPTSPGVAEAPVTITYHNGSATTSVGTLTLSGTGL